MNFELKSFHYDVPEKDLVTDLKNVATLLEKSSITFREYNKHGKYSAGTLQRRLGSWNKALHKAELTITVEKNIPVKALFENIEKIWIQKGSQPVYRDLGASPSECSGQAYTSRFGSWRKALQGFVIYSREGLSRLQTEDREITTDHKRRTKRDPSLSLRYAVLKRDSFKCTKCGRAPASNPGLVLEIDHIHPWSKGGETILSNLQTLCYDCNRGKSNNN